jgi:hypothetical protein
MRLPTALIVGASMMGAVLLPAQASAEAKVYPYASKANYCPAGLQPVTISGVICCGTPNQHMSYQQVKAQPVQKRHKAHYHTPRRATYSCLPGEKGCN